MPKQNKTNQNKFHVEITKEIVLVPEENKVSNQNASIGDDKETSTENEIFEHDRPKRYRHGERRVEKFNVLNLKQYPQNPDYVEYRESSEFSTKEKLGKLEDCFYGCDCGLLPIEWEWFFQAHPILITILSYLFVFTIIIVVCAAALMSRSVANEMVQTFGWKSVTSTYLMTLNYHPQLQLQTVGTASERYLFSNNLISEPVNCSSTHQYENFKAEISPIHYICLGPVIFAQACCLLFLTWKKFRSYTFQIATLALKVESCFLGIDLFHVCTEFIRVKLSLESEMYQELKWFKNTGISYWWTITQKQSKCCGVAEPEKEYGNKFPASCCDPLKSISKCEIYNRGCYFVEKGTLDLYSLLFIASIILIIIFSIVLIYLLEGVELGTRSIWKKPNSSFDSQNMSIETFGTVGLVYFDATKHYSKLKIKSEDFNQYSDGIFDYKYDTEYKIQFERNDTLIGQAVIESPNTTDQQLKLEMEFDETDGVVAVIY